MTELGFAFLKEIETGEIKEIRYLDSKYISIENTTFTSIVTKFIKKLYFYLFKKYSLPRSQMYEAIKINAEDIYEAHNKYLTENDLPIINYHELYSKEENKIPNYIN